jgi:hypothetical protein
MEITLDEWLEQWEAAVESGQSHISKDEAVKRYYKFIKDQDE